MNEFISVIIGGIGLGIFLNLTPLLILIQYSLEKRKDPKGFKKIEDDFIKLLKEEVK